MSERVRIEHREDGDLVARKRATGAALERLEHEAASLADIEHPGIVQFCSIRHPEEGVGELDTRWVGSHSLLTMRCRSAAQLSSLLVGVATTVADLHDMGIAHGAIEPSHVLVHSDGNPVLCGFGLTVHVPSDGPLMRDEHVLADIESIGRMTQDLLERDVGHEPTPDRRIRNVLGPRRWPNSQVQALEDVAAAAASGATARPSARQLSTMYREAVPDATTRDGAATEDESGSEESDPGSEVADSDPFARLRPTPWPDGRARTRVTGMAGVALAATVALGGIAIAGVSVAGSPRDSTSPETEHDVSELVQTGADGPGAVAVSTTAPEPGDGGSGASERPTDPPMGTPPTTAPAPTPNPSDVAIEGQRIEWDGVAWEVGRPGDAVFLGDWNCDGRATIGLVRPDTGDVFVFDDWADAGEALPSTPLGSVPDAITLHAPTPAEHCRPTLVETTHGRMVPVGVPDFEGAE